MIFKFAAVQDNVRRQYRYGNLFRKEVHTDWSRVTIAPKEKQISLMLEIAKDWGGPYGILYVLKLSRRDHKTARYQSPEPCSFDELKRFADTFEDYFEGDGRHHVWFADRAMGWQLVYDNHDLIYSYGNDDHVISLLKAKGLTEGDPAIPSPHVHCYNQEFDGKEDQIMEYFEWIEFPLQEQHDNP
ncbi:MAG: hypothetical protein ACYTEK_15155 [Planctomycetota bacterium]|jgi:hypothetical protein